MNVCLVAGAKVHRLKTYPILLTPFFYQFIKLVFKTLEIKTLKMKLLILTTANPKKEGLYTRYLVFTVLSKDSV
tara:strand:+ start:179 stop:400 length:222 start_codon:yes stop_codon:yes gene_type:complete